MRSKTAVRDWTTARHVRLFWAAAVTAFCVLATVRPVNAQTIEALTADDIEQILTEAGLPPSMRTDSSNGAPVAFATVGETEFTVRAMNCSGRPLACRELLFFANFELGRQLTVGDFVSINNFNESNVFGRAYVLRSAAPAGEVGIDYVIELDGGVSKDHITSNVERWGDVVAAFIESFTASPAGA